MNKSTMKHKYHNDGTLPTNDEIFAWYFAHPDEKLAYGDGREVAIGVVHEVDGEPKICEHGLHGSIRVIDALQYASSPILYRVKISGDVVHGEDKLCGQRREYIVRYNVEGILREFARKQALINIEKIKLYYSAKDYSLIIKWLETGDEELRSAAETATESATVRSAAWSAAKAATRSATRYAVWSAAWTATESATVWSAAWSAAKAAARSAAETATKSANVWSAAWSAAESAAESVANDMLTKMIEERFGKIPG